MRIKLRYGYRDLRNVDVRWPYCPMLDCFQPGYHTHYTPCGASGCSSRTDENLSCVRRDGRGCPPAERQHDVDPPRYRKQRGIWKLEVKP